MREWQPDLEASFRLRLQQSFCDGSSGEWKYGIFRIASCGNCVFYGICNFACAGAGKIFGSSFADPVIDGHKDGDVSDSFGILFGLTGRLFAVLLQKVKQFMGNVLENPYKRIGFVSIPLAVFLFLAWNGRYCGLGTNLIAQAFSGENCICLTGF